MKNVLSRCSKPLGAFVFALVAVLTVACIMPNNGATLGTSTKVEAAAKISKSSLSLPKGSSETIKINGNTKKVTWKSTNTKVATVNSKGKITAKKAGSVKIQGKVGSKTYTCKVRVLNFKLNKTSVTMTKGKTTTLKVSDTKSKVTYKSNNSKIATVTSKGVIKGIKKGSTSIKVKVGKETYTVPVKVETPSISKTSVTLKKGSSYKLKVNGTSRSVKWSTNNSKVATVSGGKVVAKGVGQAIITAKLNDKSYTCKVKVGHNVINCPDSITLKYGETKKFTMTATDGFSRSLSTSGIASVSISPSWFYSGDKLTMTVTGLSVGTTTLSFKSDAGWTKNCKITVVGNTISAGSVSSQINSIKVNNIKAYKSVQSNKHDIEIRASFTSNISEKIQGIRVRYSFYDKNGKEVDSSSVDITGLQKGKAKNITFIESDYSNKYNSVTSIKITNIQVFLDKSVAGGNRQAPQLSVQNKDSNIEVSNAKVEHCLFGSYYKDYIMQFSFTVKNKNSLYSEGFNIYYDLYDANGKRITTEQISTSTYDYVAANSTYRIATSAAYFSGDLSTGKIAKVVLRFERS